MCAQKLCRRVRGSTFLAIVTSSRFITCLFSIWCYYIEPRTVQVYGYAILLGVGGSLSLVTCLGMLSHLIGENVVSIGPVLQYCYKLTPLLKLDKLILSYWSSVPATANAYFICLTGNRCIRLWSNEFSWQAGQWNSSSNNSALSWVRDRNVIPVVEDQLFLTDCIANHVISS